ncbi:unnamed protein product [Arctia plantaginis]|nr:unnamed protein product [Arctia plantaginis]
MNWLILTACFCLVSCQAAEIGANKTLDNSVAEDKASKGFLEWVSNLLGGGTTPNPIVNDPVVIAKECPACQCGIARNKRRIVGGAETNVRQYPWMVMLLYNGRMFCGGSLINDMYVMTASHCTGFRKERMTVRLLEHDFTNRFNDTKVIDRKVVKVMRHTRYNAGTYDNDIALLKLNERIDLSNAIKKHARSYKEEASTEAYTAAEGSTETTSSTEATSSIDAEAQTTTAAPTTEEDDNITVRPVCLPAPGLSFTGDCGLVIGWGVTEQGGSISNTLQEVKVPIVSNEECRVRSYGQRVTENMLCAGEPEGGRDACQGDSGGPLHVFNETSGRYYEVG